MGRRAVPSGQGTVYDIFHSSRFALTPATAGRFFQKCFRLYRHSEVSGLFFREWDACQNPAYPVRHPVVSEPPQAIWRGISPEPAFELYPDNNSANARVYPQQD